MAVGLASSAVAQLRVGQWNVTNFNGTERIAEFKTAIYGVYQGRSFAPDVLMTQEMIGAGGITAFLNLLNTATGSPGDWAAAPYCEGADTKTGFFYRTSRVTYIRATRIAVGSSSTSNQPRDTLRYDIRVIGYTSPGASIGLYTTHMKAGDTATDQNRRLVEAIRIRDNAEGQDTNPSIIDPTFDIVNDGLPAGFNFLIGSDLNIQTSTQAAYQELVGSQVNNAGRFYDPINSPGNWNNNSSYRFIHTQDPAVAMDDRHDQILLCAGLVDLQGFEYIGNPNIAYSTTTWNDPNHSYRAWGNDGSTFNSPINVTTNAMVGPTIGTALKNSADGLGHLPVFLDLRVPPKITSTTTIDFGSVRRNSTQQRTITISNNADTALWTTNGIGDLKYQLTASSGFAAPAGMFTRSAGVTANSHTITMDTSTPGLKVGTITISSNAPDQPTRVITLRGRVASWIGG